MHNHDEFSILARQPILDSSGRIQAYELLFRSHQLENKASFPDPTQATARVVINALNSLGTERLLGKASAFINCDRRMLIENNFEPLDPSIFVLEILEDVIADPETVQVVQELSNRGYRIALDDFILSSTHLERVTPYLPYTNYVKVDFPSNDKDQLREVPRFFKRFPAIQCLAEKVETYSDFQMCLKFGYTLFQGYYFAKPEMLQGRKLDPRTHGVMQILQVLQKDPDINEIEDCFKREPELTFSLLKFINSASIGMKSRIESIRQAIQLVGHRKLQQWLTLMVFAGGNTSTEGNAILTNACQRARFLELLASHSNLSNVQSQQAFLVGMLSYMDALCKVPLTDILNEFDLGLEMALALLRQEGSLGKLLVIAKELEQDQTTKVFELCQKIGVSIPTLRQCLSDSWSWAHSFSNPAVAT